MLAKHGARSLTIANRTAARAERLASRVHAELAGVHIATGPPRVAAHDLVVNATALGMRPDDPLPIDLAELAPGTLVADVVVGESTPLLRAAAARGAVTHPGGPMLEAQIALMIDFMLP